MMNIIKVKSRAQILYSDFERLYQNSFPIFEQRTEEQQAKALSSPYYNLDLYEENGVFIGFIAYWNFDTYIYIEHFAIDDRHRGKGYGSIVLKEFIKQTDKIVLLEIDPVVDDISAARLRFYQKCDFYENIYNHTHPPYREGYKGHPLTVLTTQRNISEKEYSLFNNDLNNIIMN